MLLRQQFIFQINFHSFDPHRLNKQDTSFGVTQAQGRLF